MLEIPCTKQLRALSPDFLALQSSHRSINGVLVTAEDHGEFDFHSRYFWPWSGSDEDPVTGGTHTFLAKYWSRKKGKSKLRSFQSSKRTGQMEVDVIDENHMTILGQAVVVLEGILSI